MQKPTLVADSHALPSLKHGWYSCSIAEQVVNYAVYIAIALLCNVRKLVVHCARGTWFGL